MPTFRITYRPERALPPEEVEGDRVVVEGDRHVVVRRTVLVIGQPREVVVRRLSGDDVVSVDRV